MKTFIFIVVNLTLLISSVYLQDPDCRVGSLDPRCNQNKGTNRIDGDRNAPDYYDHQTGKTWCKKRYADILCIQMSVRVCADGKLRRLCCEVCQKPKGATTDTQTTAKTDSSKRPDNWNICMICLKYSLFCLETDWKLFGCEAYDYLKQKKVQGSIFNAGNGAKSQDTSKRARISSNTNSSQGNETPSSQSPKQCLKPNPAKICLQIDQAILCSVHYMKWTCCQNCV